MKERPILFSAPMVREILAGTKTQTRRVWKLPRGCSWYAGHGGEAAGMVQDDDGPAWWHVSEQRCPYGQPGDRLWVREAWADQHPLAIQDGRYSQPGRAGIPGPPPVAFRTIYRADGEPLQVWSNGNQSHPYLTRSGPASQIDSDFPAVASNYQRKGKAIYWNPSIHMPRWASRITLQVTNVRVERLQDISELDARAEGAPELLSVDGGYLEHPMGCYRDGFQHLWTSINGPGSWDTNPWVWVVEFRRLDVAGLLDA